MTTTNDNLNAKDEAVSQGAYDAAVGKPRNNTYDDAELRDLYDAGYNSECVYCEKTKSFELYEVSNARAFSWS